MNQIIIYGSYDQDEYTNYYHLINNGEALIEYSEEIDGLFQQINDTKNEVKKSILFKMKMLLNGIILKCFRNIILNYVHQVGKIRSNYVT